MSDAVGEDGIRLSAHPRARRHIAMAKGWGGLGAFALVVWLSQRAGVPTGDALLRGLIGGIAGYLVSWGVAVTVWRQIALAELERLRRRLLAQAAAQAAGGPAPDGSGGPVPQR
ncbi:MAG TPA: hypothetical protein VFT50_14855 [Baekduia sp.]|nr:hypothetical protein [Baekduia sp.]